MINAIPLMGRKALLAWIDLVRRGAGLVALLTLLSSVASAFYVARHLSINSDTSEMLSPELSFRKLTGEIDAAFPQFSDTILIVVEGDTPDLADEAAEKLSDRLRKHPDLFGEPFFPEGEPFFRKNGLLFSDLNDLYALGDRMAKAQPFLVSLWQDSSLRGLFDLLTLALGAPEAAPGEANAGLKFDDVLDAISAVAEAQASGRFARLSWRRLMDGPSGNVEKTERRLIVIQPALEFASLHPASRSMDAVRAFAAEMKLDPAHGVRVRMTGSAALAEEELRSVEEGIGTANVLSLVLVSVLLLIGLKSLRLVAPVLATLLVGLLWTSAFAFLVVGQLNLISVAFAVLFIGLGVDFGIHFSLRYQEGINEGCNHGEALRRAAAGVGGPLTLCAAAAAIGFFSFLPTDYRGFAELGLIAGIGMFVALFANLTVLPALLTLAPARAVAPSHRTHETREGEATPLEKAVIRHGRGIAIGALVLTMAAASLAPGMRFDFDPLHLRDPHSESVGTLYDLMRDNQISPYSVTILAQDRDSAKILAERLKKLDLVRSATTIDDYVPKEQDDKLDVIATMAVFLAPLQSPPRATPPTAAERKASLTALLQALGKRSDAPSRRLLASLSPLAGEGSDEALIELETRLLDGLPAQLTALRESLTAETFGLEDLPAAIRNREIAADGRTRVEAMPKENPKTHDDLRRFVEAVRSVTPLATGGPVEIVEAGDAIIGAFLSASAITIVLLAVLLAVLLRNLRDGLLVFAPLVLASLLTAATAALADLPINFANVIILPLLFGIGIANGIQFVYRERLESDPIRLLRTSTPRAVTFSALTTVVSLGSLATSSHPGTASMGILLGIALIYTLLCTLVVLPATMASLPSKISSRIRSG